MFVEEEIIKPKIISFLNFLIFAGREEIGCYIFKFLTKRVSKLQIRFHTFSETLFHYLFSF